MPVLFGTNHDEGSIFGLLLLGAAQGWRLATNGVLLVLLLVAEPAVYLIVPGLQFPLNEFDMNRTLFHFYPNQTQVDLILEMVSRPTPFSSLEALFSTTQSWRCGVLRGVLLCCEQYPKSEYNNSYNRALQAIMRDDFFVCGTKRSLKAVHSQQPNVRSPLCVAASAFDVSSCLHVCL